MPEPVKKPEPPKKPQEKPQAPPQKLHVSTKVFDANQVPEPIEPAVNATNPEPDFEHTEMSMNDPLIDAKQPISAVDFQCAQKELLDTEIVQEEKKPLPSISESQWAQGAVDVLLESQL